MQYNFKEASSPKKIGNINPLYRPGLEHLEEDFGKQAIMSLKR